MKSRTSFFKPVTLKKDIFRYAPLWALYFIGVMMVLVTSGGYAFYDYMGREMDDLVMSFGVVNICYAGMAAAMLFGDLYNTKLCYSLHAMPVRRESWLLTHLVAGLLFSLVPNLVATLYLMTQLEAYWFLALYWLLAVTLQYLFFFGLATVSALLTGSRFAMLAVYAGFNFVSMLLYATLQTIYLPLMEGVSLPLEGFSQFSPVVKLFAFKYFTFTSTQKLMYEAWGSDTRTFYVFEGLADGWGYMAILGLAGLAAMGIALWLYRIRSLESAGDFVAFPRLKGISCIIITLCVTLAAALVGEAFNGSYLFWMAVGLVVGFFGSLMLLERRVKVFRKRTFLGFAILAIVATLTMVGVEQDWLGIVSWTPKANRVESVTVSNQRGEDYRYYDGSRLTATLTDPEDIAQIILAHEEMLERRNEAAMSRYFVVLTYKMKSGRTVERYYSPPAEGEQYRIIQRYLYVPENMLGFQDWQDVSGRVQYLYTSQGEVPEALYDAVLKALQEDCRNGQVLTQMETSEYIEYHYVDKDGRMVYRSLGILSGAQQLHKLLSGPEMLLGYGAWDNFLQNIGPITCNAMKVSYEQKEGLLEALRKDAEAGLLVSSKYGNGGIEIYYSVSQEKQGELHREFYVNQDQENTWAWMEANGFVFH